MTQDERWDEKYNEMMAFMAKNHRRPSKFIDEERGKIFVARCKKLDREG